MEAAARRPTTWERARVDVSKPTEVVGWCNKWGVPPERLRAAVAEVGTSAVSVARALGKPERTVVVLHVLFRYTFDEIAAMSGEPRGTVSSRYTRALRALRQHLRAQADAEPGHDWMLRTAP